MCNIQGATGGLLKGQDAGLDGRLALFIMDLLMFSHTRWLLVAKLIPVGFSPVLFSGG